GDAGVHERPDQGRRRHVEAHGHAAERRAEQRRASAEAARDHRRRLISTPDLLDPAFYADVEQMHEALRALRAQGPVWRDERNALWAVLGHAEVTEVELQDEV